MLKSKIYVIATNRRSILTTSTKKAASQPFDPLPSQRNKAPETHPTPLRRSRLHRDFPSPKPHSHVPSARRAPHHIPDHTPPTLKTGLRHYPRATAMISQEGQRNPQRGASPAARHRQKNGDTTYPRSENGKCHHDQHVSGNSGGVTCKTSGTQRSVRRKTRTLTQCPSSP